jgi:hypothetical protein
MAKAMSRLTVKIQQHDCIIEGNTSQRAVEAAFS